jgi:hypothetical protein
MDDRTLDVPQGDEPFAGIVLFRIGEKYWLGQGDEWLQQLLTGEGDFPRPVLCVAFKDNFELTQFAGGGSGVSDLWGINPEIVARLRRDNQLTDLVFDAG